MRNALWIISIVAGMLMCITICSGCGTIIGATMGAVQGGAKGAKCDMVAAGATVAAMSQQSMAQDAMNGTGDYQGLGSIVERLQEGGY